MCWVFYFAAAAAAAAVVESIINMPLVFFIVVAFGGSGWCAAVGAGPWFNKRDCVGPSPVLHAHTSCEISYGFQGLPLLHCKAVPADLSVSVAIGLSR